MRPLVVVRRATAFEPRFIERDALFWPVAPAYRRLGALDDFPEVAALGRVFAGDGPVRFVPAEPRRRRGTCVDPGALYDARITLDRVVPTRPCCWHDLMNALVWGTFPEAKQSLHARQHRAIAARVEPGARGLPPRTRELDALALVDEGGVLLLAREPDRAAAALASRRSGVLASLLRSGDVGLQVFGHAIYESLALGARPAVVAALVVGLDPAAPAGLADRRLAAILADPGRLLSPRELVRVDLAEAEASQRGAMRIAPSRRMSSPFR